MSNLYTFWMGLSNEQKAEFAEKSELSPAYINTHLIHRRKTPPLDKLNQMAVASGGELSYHGLCDFFLHETQPETA